MLMDIILLIIGVLVITYSAIEGFARSLMQLIIFYVATLILGMVMLSVNTAQGLARRVSEMLGGYPNQSLYETVLFLGILIPTTIGIFLLTHFTMENIVFSRIQWLDTLLGIVCGLLLALCLMSLISNAWGIIVSTAWPPERTWMTLRSAYTSSILRIQMERVLAVYRALLFPFKMTRYPSVYTLPY